MDRIVNVVNAVLLAGRWVRAYLVTLFMLAAVLLPIYGPWLDAHFVERLPQHDHIFIGEIDPHHHNHDHAGAPHHHDCLDFPSSAVASVPDQDAALRGLALWLWPDNALSFQPADTFGFPIWETSQPVAGTIVPPLDEPPRV